MSCSYIINGVYRNDSFALKYPIFSCGKVLESFAVAMLVDSGKIYYDTYIDWLNCTLEDLCQHRAGRAYITNPFESIGKGVEILNDMDSLKKWVLSMPQVFPRDDKHSTYHAVTRGILLDLLFVEYTGMRLFKYIEVNIITKAGLGENDISIGVQVRDKKQIQKIEWDVTFLYKFIMRQNMTRNQQTGVWNVLTNKNNIMQAFIPVRGLIPSAIELANTPNLELLPLTSMTYYATTNALLEITKYVLNKLGCNSYHFDYKNTYFDINVNDSFHYTFGGLAVDYFLKGWVGWSGAGGSVLIFNPSNLDVFTYIPSKFGNNIFPIDAIKKLKEVKNNTQQKLI